MTTRERNIQILNELYFALGTLDSAIERLANRAQSTNDWDWIKGARITVNKAREAYNQLGRQQ